MQLLDVVATLTDKTITFPYGLTKEITAGSEGTLVDELAPGVWEVEFSRSKSDAQIHHLMTAEFEETELRLVAPIAIAESENAVVPAAAF